MYGISAWDIVVDARTRQSGLRIAKPGQDEEEHTPITVDNIEIAQFINLLVDHRQLGQVISAVVDKGVLILGRFSEPARKALLKAVATRLRDREMLPVIFDFKRPSDRDFTETVKTLAGLSSFVIADVTNPESVPLEAQAVVPDYMVPFVPLLQKGRPAFSMLRDLQTKHREWVLPVVSYAEVGHISPLRRRSPSG